MVQLKITNVMTLNPSPPNATMNDTKISQNSLDKPPLTLMQCPVHSLQVPVVDKLRTLLDPINHLPLTITECGTSTSLNKGHY